MFTVYAIHNSDADKIYIGQTQNLEERLQMRNLHLIPKAYTARYPGFWTLVYFEVHDSREKALERERQLKSFRGREFVRKHIYSPVAQR